MLAEAEELEATTTVKSWPVPLRLTVWVLFATSLLLSVMVSVPVRVPAAVGVKVTLIVQLAPAVTEFPHVVVCAKSPLVAMLEMVSGASPLLVNVTFCPGEVELTISLPNDRLLGEKEI